MKLALFETKRVYNIAVIDAYVNAFSLRSVSQCICLICQIYTPSEAGPYFQVLFLLAVAAELHLCVLYLEGTRNLLLSGLINDIQFVVFSPLLLTVLPRSISKCSVVGVISELEIYSCDTQSIVIHKIIWRMQVEA